MTHDAGYPLSVKILHGGIAIFGITAFMTAELAENGSESAGYLVHASLGLALALFVLVRAVGGIAGSGWISFSGWSPLSVRQWKLALEDVRSLGRLTVPQRELHQGLSGLVQAFGLALFAWMGVSGTGLFLLADGANAARFEMMEELHEMGEGLIPLYLALHVGSVVLHSVAGTPIWQRMWKFGSHYGQSHSSISATSDSKQV